METSSSALTMEQYLAEMSTPVSNNPRDHLA